MATSLTLMQAVHHERVASRLCEVHSKLLCALHLSCVVILRRCCKCLLNLMQEENRLLKMLLSERQMLAAGQQQ